MRSLRMPLGVVLLASSLLTLLSAVELQDNTVLAWEQHVRNADSRMQARLDGRQPFLWSDEAADRKVRLQRGEI
jgi:hypothetical protein